MLIYGNAVYQKWEKQIEQEAHIVTVCSFGCPTFCLSSGGQHHLQFKLIHPTLTLSLYVTTTTDQHISLQQLSSFLFIEL